ncbi:MAG TPA: putative baseplate assembly protein [Pyrinomonadaceae bacterium]|nr:putative baseplate assembly protein [Pyrinomonadaceae bacterium]
MKASETCRDRDPRRRRIRESGLNGIDYIEQDAEDPKLFRVFFLGKAPAGITELNVRVDGGVRIRDIGVVAIGVCALEGLDEDDCLRVWMDKVGDWSTYTLRLVGALRGRPGDEPLDGLDPLYAEIDFTFTANCRSDLDCLPAESCPPELLDEPEIDYLAKDYASFRQLILDRLSLVMPDWKERHVPDIGIALVELFAYVGDYLSYYQDAVATEAYLDTARQRISVRRHCALVDYHLHEGCNARAWVHVNVSGVSPEGLALEDPRDYFFITAADAALPPGQIVLKEDDLRGVATDLYKVFEPLLPSSQPVVRLYEAHNEIHFYTWGERECCLQRGATSATLVDGWLAHPPGGDQQQYDDDKQEQYDKRQEQYNKQEQYEAKPEQRDVSKGRRNPPDYGKAQPATSQQDDERVLRLRVGDVLIFEEVLGPKTGARADADMSHRHAVRLTRVEPTVDALYDALVVNIEWAVEDALPFPLCISSLGRAPDCEYLENVSVARGNIILCDHGRTIGPELHDVPEADEEDAGCYGPNDPREMTLNSVRFRPKLKYAVLTHGVEYPRARTVARQQARALGGVMSRVVARVEQIWKTARGGAVLGAAEHDELRTIFGERALARAGLDAPRGKRRPPQSAAEQAEAVGKLLEQADRLLSKKARRLEVLRGRGLAGYLLGQRGMLEIEEMFGTAFIEALSSRHTLGPASAAYRQSPREAMPFVLAWRARASERQGVSAQPASPPARRSKLWTPQRNLIASSAADRHFVAEIDNERFAILRFGEGELGRAPTPGSALAVSYRVGNGRAGNIGAEAISRIVFRKTTLSGITLKVRNPLPTAGGVEPEPLDEAKMFAPGAFRKELQRAITSDDYARLTERDHIESVQRAAGDLRWSGSWYGVRVAVDPLGAASPPDSLLREVGWGLEQYRRVGHDLAVLPAGYVSLDVSMTVCVKPHYLRAHVKSALMDLLSNRVLAGGRRGFFHPDNMTFGEGVYLSRLVSAALAVPGVESVHLGRVHGRTLGKLQRLFEAENDEIENGVLPLSALEVARLDNDPNFPEHGRLVLNVRGGR